MGLIINRKIPALLKGYPTVSDKYNAQGGVLEGTAAVGFGDLVAYGTQTGHYVPYTNTSTQKVAGIVLATNVKLAVRYPGDSSSVETLPGEGFNLLLNGYIAVQVDTLTGIKEGEPVYVKVVSGVAVFTPTAAGATALANTVFTGITETKGTTYLAEIRYNM